MPKTLTWDDAEDIGILLSEAHPDLDPLAVRSSNGIASGSCASRTSFNAS